MHIKSDNAFASMTHILQITAAEHATIVHRTSDKNRRDFAFALHIGSAMLGESTWIAVHYLASHRPYCACSESAPNLRQQDARLTNQ
jgi:hypothetical protein